MKITGSTRLVGVFGWPVRHSLSPVMHQAAFDALGLNWAYLPYAVAPENLESALRALPALGIAGVNCTIPHKEAVARIVDEIDPEARRIARYQGKIKQMLGLRKCRDDRHEIVLQQLEPNCLRVAERENRIGMGGLRRAGLAQCLRQSSIVLE